MCDDDTRNILTVWCLPTEAGVSVSIAYAAVCISLTFDALTHYARVLPDLPEFEKNVLLYWEIRESGHYRSFRH
jgi:hypothetical protein